MADIATIRARIKRPTASVVLCLDSDLFGEYQALDARLRQVSPGASLAGNPEADDLIARMEVLRGQMVGSEVTFRFQALPALDFANLRAKMPTKKDGQADDEFVALYHAWVCEIVASSCVDPVMTPTDAAGLASDLADSQWRQLQNAAWEVNADIASIPFSVTASVIARSSVEKSKPPEPSPNPEAGSLAGNPASESTSSATSKATSQGGQSRPSRSGRKKTATS